MQDIIFYVAPCGTRGVVRDCSNAHNAVPPTITRGIPVRLHMRLFSDRYSCSPYPTESFSGVVSWSWIMDDDWDRGTICKLIGDGSSIAVRTVSDTVNSQALQFTEFVIPIYNTDTDMLRTWLGRDQIKAGLQGELIGRDNDGDPVFVLQIDNFSVRNRVSASVNCGGEAAGNGVTREQVADMIQSAFSGATLNVENVVSAASAGYAATAGTATVAASLPEDVYSGITSSIINTAKADIQSGGTAYYASSASTAGEASGLTSAAKSSLVSEIIAAGGGSGGSGGSAVIIYSGGTADYASAAGTASALVSDYIVSSASAATVASSLPEDVYSGITSSIINTAKADIQSGGTAYYASSAGTAGEASGLTSAAKSSIIAEAIAAGAGASGGTVVVSGGTATTSSFGTVKVNTSVTASDTGTDADATVPTVNAMIAYVGSQTPSFVQQAGYAVNAGFATKAGEAPYNGPFAVGVTSAGITVAGGRMYLGGAEYAVGSTTLTSSNGTVYYYVYYSSGSYYSGCSVAASASALATAIRGSQGYFTALANVSGGVVTQCHYGDIRIDGRVV